MISFKLITFCKILLNQICRRPALYKQQWEVSQIIKIKRKKERHVWVKAQFFLVTFTLSSKNIVNQSQLIRTEPTLWILYLPSVKEWRKWAISPAKIIICILLPHSTNCMAVNVWISQLGEPTCSIMFIYPIQSFDEARYSQIIFLHFTCTAVLLLSKANG